MAAVETPASSGQPKARETWEFSGFCRAWALVVGETQEGRDLPWAPQLAGLWQAPHRAGRAVGQGPELEEEAEVGL